ncbi:MAG TPA: HAD family hydrolase, partial [Anaerolineae bacterium]|nr:HAD family hydrolase [Anaerolineae bacterium]
LVLEENLVAEGMEEAEAESSESPVSALRKRIPSLSRLFRRSEDKESEAAEETEAPREEQAAVQEEANPAQTGGLETEQPPEGSESEEPEDPPSTEDEEPRQSFFRRFAARVRRTLPGKKEETEQAETAEEPKVHENVLLFAYSPQVVSLHAPDGSPRLPQDLIPLCRLRYSEQVRPEAIETIRTFAETGVNIKIFSSSAPDQTAAILRQAGLGTDDEAPMGILSGSELAEMDGAQLEEAVQANTIFGLVTAEQTALVVQILRKKGQAVAVIGDGVNDVPPMRQANLSIARRSSSQAALSVADIVLLQDSPKVLLDILNKGQRIVNGLLDVLRLYLTQALYLAVLIVATMLVARSFPYTSKQGSIIAIVTISLPSIALSLWAAAGQLPTKDLRRLLAHFVLPASLTISAAGLVVYVLFLERTSDRAYTQLVLTYALVAMGLLLVLFLRPPIRLLGGGSTKAGGRRFTVVVVVLLVAFLLVSMIPLAYELFLLEPLRQPGDYAVVGVVVLGWAVTLRFIWWAMPFVDRVERATRTLAGRSRPIEKS